MRTKISSTAVMLLLISLLLSACSFGDIALGASNPIDPPLRVTPTDTSPQKMVVKLTIIEDQDAADRMSLIRLQIGTGEIEEYNYANFHHGEYVVCNGVKQLLGDQPTYTIKVSPSTYTCTYIGYKPGTGLLTSGPTITVPTAGELLPQPPVVGNSGYTIHFNGDKYNPSCNIVGMANDLSGDNIQGKPSSSGLGFYKGPITSPTISSLKGTGAILLTRTCKPEYNGLFKTLTVTYQSLASVEVTWSH